MEAIDSCALQYAMELRTKERLSLKLISEKTGISKATLSVRLRDFPLEKEEIISRSAASRIANNSRSKQNAEQAAEARRIKKGDMLRSEHLSRMALGHAISYFSSIGHTVSVPVDQTAYDIAVDTGSAFKRVQVKSTRSVDRRGRWVARTSRRIHDRTSNLGRRAVPYSPEHVDTFFILTGCLDIYVIPVNEVVSTALVLDEKYSCFKVSGCSSVW